MPIMQVHYPEGTLDAAAKADLAGRLTEILLDMEGGARTEGGRAFASVLFTRYARDDWWVGGHTDGRLVAPPGAMIIRVTIPEGYMNAATKSGVHADVTAAALRATGCPPSAGAGGGILVNIEEVPEGNWAAGGRTLSIASIARTVGLDPAGARFAWVRAYFAAKARLRTAFGVPADAAGLPAGFAEVVERPRTGT